MQPRTGSGVGRAVAGGWWACRWRSSASRITSSSVRKRPARTWSWTYRWRCAGNWIVMLWFLLLCSAYRDGSALPRCGVIACGHVPSGRIEGYDGLDFPLDGTVLGSMAGPGHTNDLYITLWRLSDPS